MKLYFKNSFGDYRFITNCDNSVEVNAAIDSFITQAHAWTDEGGRIWYDVGSWSEFFVLEQEASYVK